LIEYFPAEDIKNRVNEIIDLLMFDHVKAGNVYCIRSRGSQSRRTIARIHGLGRIWQLAMKIDATYIVEIISEQFDPLSKESQDRVLVHELLHIPHSFQGGFRHHKDYVTRENVDVWFKRLQDKRRELGRLRKG
jgi:predicted metallopeptidase